LFQILIKPQFSGQVFEKKILKYQISLKNPSNGSRDVPCGRTDRHEEASSRFSQFLRTPRKNRLVICFNVLIIHCLCLYVFRPCYYRSYFDTI